MHENLLACPINMNPLIARNDEGPAGQVSSDKNVAEIDTGNYFYLWSLKCPGRSVYQFYYGSGAIPVQGCLLFLLCLFVAFVFFF